LQGGGGLAAGFDSNSVMNLYFSTADGTFDLNSTQAPNTDAGDSFVKLSADLSTVNGYFTPADQLYRSCTNNDLDFGSGGVAIIPDNTISAHPYVAVKADKEGGLWAIDRTNPGSYNIGSCNQTACPNTLACSLQTQSTINQNLQTVITQYSGSPGYFHTTPAYWNNGLYLAGSSIAGNPAMPLTLYPLAGRGGCQNPNPVICSNITTSSVSSKYGATPSVSSNGTNNGIVWMIANDGNPVSKVPGVLYAVNANTMTEIYDSNQCFINHVQVDQPGPATKFSVPTIANGYAYMGAAGVNSQGTNDGTVGTLSVYGTIPNRSCSSQ
jgi:hypothetical protein